MANEASGYRSWPHPERSSPACAQDYRTLALVFLLALVILATGLGLRDPWPSDEPRFAAIARDMLASGDWLFPRIGGNLYADKPPIFFWIMAFCIWLTGSVRTAFLLPGVVAGGVTLIAVFDLTRRLYDRRTALIASLTLLTTVQFAIEFREAQIDPVLVMLTTLGLYGFLRHILLGPSWGWYMFGGLCCGVGIATKGVGFLPFLLLPIYAVFAKLGWGERLDGGWRWSLAPLAAFAGTGIWLVPMLIAVATADDPSLAAYRNEILFGQTVDRYASAQGHLRGWWYFLETIPWAWLPVSLAIPLLIKPWKESFEARDLRIVLPLVWIVLVVVFFSLSSGKRGVYILPAVPALALISAPFTSRLWRSRGLHYTAFGSLSIIAVVAAIAVVYFFAVNPAESGERLYGSDTSEVALILPFLIVSGVWLIVWRPRRGLAALVSFLLCTWPIVGLYVYPRLDVSRSGKIIMDHAYEQLPAGGELGIAGQKESFILHARGQLTNFGHRRTDSQQEQYDAARWLAAGENRYLIISAPTNSGCFSLGNAVDLGYAHGEEWLLIPHTGASAECARLGDSDREVRYVAPPSTLDRSDA